jgi:hypothetical protein
MDSNYVNYPTEHLNVTFNFLFIWVRGIMQKFRVLAIYTSNSRIMHKNWVLPHIKKRRAPQFDETGYEFSQRFLHIYHETESSFRLFLYSS